MTWFREYLRSFSDEPDLQLILLVQTAYRIAMGLVAVFLPVFLYRQGVGVAGVLLFYCLRYFFFVLVAPAVAVYLDRLGATTSLISSLPFMVAGYALAGSVSSIGPLFAGVALLLSLHGALYNFAIHYTIIPALTVKDSGKQLATLSLISEVGRYIAPVIAGVLATTFGFGTLFAIAATIVAASTVPLFCIELEAKQKVITDFEDFTQALTTTWKKPGRMLSFTGYALPQTINGVVWPIFITVFVGGIVELGIITTLSALIGLALVSVFGIGSDRGYEAPALWASSAVYAGLFALRALAGTPFSATLLDTLRRPAYKASLIPWKKQMTTIAKQEHTLAFIVARGIAYKAVRLIFLPLFIIAFLNGMSLAWGLVIGAAFILLMPMIGQEYNQL